MATDHILEVGVLEFNEIIQGRQTHLISSQRHNNRDICTGDKISIVEVAGIQYTERQVAKYVGTVTHIMERADLIAFSLLDLRPHEGGAA